MKELKPTKAERVTIPKQVKRYCVAYYTESQGWQNTFNFFTTPESALEDFLRVNKTYNKDDYNYPKFYTVYELELEIPII